MTQPVETKPLCPACQERVSRPYPGDLCRKCYDIKRAAKPSLANLNKLQDRLRDAEATGDWKKLAADLQPTVTAIASGTVKATAAQSSLLKHILDRAYGKVSKSQEDKLGPIGVVVLPVFGDNNTTTICPDCLAAHVLHKAQ